MNRQDFYSARSAELAQRIKVLRGRARGFVAGEIASFAAAVAGVVLFTLTADSGLRTAALVGAAVALAAYVAVRLRDTQNDARIVRLEELRQVYDNELRALGGDFACYDDGLRYADPRHAYTYDLDIFGRDGLYQRMNRLATTGGCDALAERLSSLDDRAVGREGGRAVDGCDEAYRAHIETLARDEAFRSAFISYGVRHKIDTHAIRRALHAAGEVRVSRWFAHPAVLALAVADLVAFLACVVLAAMGRVHGLLPVWWGILQFFGVYLLCMGTLREVSKAVDRLHGQVQRLADMARLMAARSQGQPRGKGVEAVAESPAGSAKGGDVFLRLTQLLDGLDKRGNIMGLFVVNTFALYDFFLVRKFVQWSRADKPELDRWIDRVVEMDLDVTVATFLYNHPHTCWAEITADEGVAYEARGLYHPFLGDRAVRNDFDIDDRHFYIITGANMAGKSTFLRAIGVNYVLARLGMPVFATSMRVSRFRLFSSMRTTDDLAHGISYFNAELLRLKQLIGSVAAARSEGEPAQPTLIILDEILKGTNSLDKLNGSRLFLEYVARLPVSGIVATHDLELSKMAGERYHNYCFEIELGTDVTYSYKITPGVARNQNATFLLKQLLKGM